jgi:hypothetical protein
MRVSMKWDTLAGPCEAPFDYGESEDYTVNIQTDAMCDAPSNLFVTDLTERTVTLHWNVVGGAASYVLEFRETGAPNWAEFSPTAANETPLVYLVPCTAYEFRVKTECADGESSYSAPFVFTTKGCSNYCYSYGEDSTPFPAPDEWIENVNIGDINNTSGNNWGYADFTNLSTSLVQGNAYTLNLTPGFSASTYLETWSVWIDFNKDNDFEDAGEQVFTNTGSNATVSGTFTVPNTTATGNTRMRVTMKWDILAGPCEAPFEYGESEDYTVIFNNPAAILTLAPSSLNFPAAGNSQTITLTTNCDWSAANIPSWLTVNPSSGTAGTFTLTVTAAANSSSSAQSATLTFSGCNGQATQNLAIAQGGVAAVLTINPASLTFPAAGNSQTITLTTNCDWQVTNVPPWLTVNPSSGAAGTFTLTVTAIANGSTSAQLATLTFTGCNGQATQNLGVLQHATLFFSANPLQFNVGNNADCVSLTLSTNTAWTATASVPWITINPPSGNGGGTVEICFQANPDTIVRTGEVTFTPVGAAPVVVTVTQAKTTGVNDVGAAMKNSVTCIPNPASNDAWFVIQADRQQNVNLEVVAEDGRVVVSLNGISVDAGQNRVHWQPRDLPAGNYVFRCFFEKEIISGKIVLMR